ncbi:hypothetical protein [Oceanobacillus sp. CF4.6]|uniref:hypothetical protein n=1 Tax=Oceanobacillus sp. CF4.6 TaxID=3373080 RepID=UPI003EE6C4DB
MLKTKIDVKQKLFINGQWLEAGECAPLYSPYNGGELTKIPVATMEETESVIEAAVIAQSVMKKLSKH